MGLEGLFDHDPWEEPTKEDYKQIDEQLLTKLVICQLDLRPEKAMQRFIQIRDVVRWYLAFNIDGWVSRRRLYSQKRTAYEKEFDLTVIQDKVRDCYDGKSGNKGAQKLFEDDLEKIESAYESHLEAQ